MKFLLLFTFFLSLNNYASSRNCLMELDDQGTTLCAGIDWVNGLEERKTIDLELLFWAKDDSKQELVDPSLHFFPYLWMYMDNGVQHGSRSLAVDKIETGKYLIKNLFLIPMRGFWTFQIAMGPDQIPQTTSIPVNKKPEVNDSFLGKFLITDNAKIRFDFINFPNLKKKGFVVWNRYSDDNPLKTIQVYLYETDSAKMIKLNQENLVGKIIDSQFVLQSNLTFEEKVGPFYQSSSFSFPSKEKHFITISIDKNGVLIDNAVVEVSFAK